MKETYAERVHALRSDPNVHYNCAQAILVTFADVCGLTGEQALNLGNHFGSGMKMGETCGAITSGLMVIGLLGGGEEQRRQFISGMKGNHGGLINCRDLLRVGLADGTPKKVHCDGMVYEAVDAVCDIMRL